MPTALRCNNQRRPQSEKFKNKRRKTNVFHSSRCYAHFLEKEATLQEAHRNPLTWDTEDPVYDQGLGGSIQTGERTDRNLLQQVALLISSS